MDMSVVKETKMIWGYGLAFMAIFMAIGQFDVLPFDLTLGALNGIVLLILAATLLSETFFQGRFNPKNTADAIGLLVGGSAVILAVVSFGNIVVPPMLRGVVAFLYAILAGMIVIELYR